MNDTQTRRLARAVYEARSARGWSQDRLAKEARIAPNTVVRIECERLVRSSSVAKVMSALGIGPEALIESDLIGLLAAKDAEIERLRSELSWASTAHSLNEWQARYRKAEDKCNELLTDLLAAEKQRDRAARIATTYLDFLEELTAEFSRSGRLSSSTSDRVREAIHRDRATLKEKV